MNDEKKIKDRRLFYKINLSQRILTKHVDREIRQKLGISTIQAAVLFYLIENDGCHFKDLSSVLLQAKSAITTLVLRMKKNGLIIIKQSEHDKRASNIYLTDKGRELGKEATPLVKGLNQTLLDDFSREESDIIHRFLDKIISDYS